jgi:hypothetical protein
MTRLLASIKADMMNRTLYALTLITAVATPVTFLTGTATRAHVLFIKGARERLALQPRPSCAPA